MLVKLPSLSVVSWFIIGVPLSFSLFSCDKLDKKEQVPSFLKIEKVNLKTDYPIQGSSSSKFIDAWVYIDDEPLGVYELPSSIPVLLSGIHEVKVRGGIKVNGISSTRPAYSLCGFYSEVVYFENEQTSTIEPTVEYFSAANFKWKEDFENVGTTILSNSNGKPLLVTTNPNYVFEGKGSGYVQLNADSTFFECTSSVSYSLPLEDVFLEFDYKCTNSFSVGIYAANKLNPYTTVIINPSLEWNKIYVNLVNEIGIANSPPYEIFFSMTKSENVDVCELYLDNIKLVHQ